MDLRGIREGDLNSGHYGTSFFNSAAQFSTTADTR